MYPDFPKSLLRSGTTYAARESSSIGEAHYRTLIELLPQVVWMADPDGSTTYCNQYWYEFSGLSPEETAGSGWASILHPDDTERALANWRQAVASSSSFQGEYRYRRASDGEYRWHLTKGSPLKDATGRIVKWIGLATEIHEHKMADAALAKRDEQLNIAIEAAQLGTWEHEEASNTLIISPRYREIFGLAPGDVLDGERFLAMIHPEDRPTLELALNQAANGKGSPDFAYEYRIVRPDGELRWIAATGRFRFSDLTVRRQFIGSTGTIQDITRQKLASEALKASESRLRTILDIEPECVKLLSRETNLLEMNGAGLEMIQADSLDQVLGKPLIGHVCEPYRERVSEVVRRVFEGEPGKLEFEFNALKGKRRWLQMHATPLMKKDGKVEALLGITRDITEQKQTEAALRLSEEKFKLAFRSSPDSITLTTLKGGTYLDVNDAFLRLTGWQRDDVIGRTSADIDVWVDHNDREKMMHALAESGRVLALETRFRKKSGEAIFAQVSAETVDIGGEKCLLLITRDVTEQMRAAELLRISEEKYRSVIENSPYGFCQTTREGRFLMVNPALVRMLGYRTAEEVLALDIETQVYIDPAAHRQLFVPGDSSGEMPPFEAAWKRKDGENISVRLVVRPIYDAAGYLTRMEKFVENVTEQRAIEKQLQIAQKMEVVGQLAGGIAHDFNNLLMIMGSRAEMILEQVDDLDSVMRQANEIMRTSRRAATLTRELLAFSRDQVLQPSVLNLNQLVQELGNMLPRLIGEHIETRIITAPGSAMVKVDRGQFEQVVMNLAINARDAMPHGGSLRIETRRVSIGQADNTQPELSPGRYVLLTISDSGIGMTAEIQARIFEPFFTTKERGRGTGLGLAMVYGTVQQSGGHICVESAPGKGTSFKIYVPEVAQHTDPEKQEKILGPAWGCETILFVEDEDALREVGCEILSAKGYNVVSASNGEEALQIVKTSTRPIDLLITDLIMPRMGGIELAKRALSLYPQISVIYVSGYSGQPLMGDSLVASALFLQKPFDIKLLANYAREALDKARSRNK